MSNLLDKSSIVLTPTAYDNSKVLCVKPSDGSGDFDFSRNSAATRVNAQGLVENVQILSSNLVQNGDFSEQGAEEVSNGSFSQEGVELVTNGSFDTDTNWNGVNTNGVTISNGGLNYSETPNGTNITQGSVVEIGKSYKVTLTISNYVKGAALVILGAGGTTQEISANGTFTIYGVASINTTLYIQARGASGTTLSIDNVSVREVGQDWSLETGWSIGDGVAIGNSTTRNIQQLGILQSNKTYKLTYTILDYVSGSVRPNVGTVAGTTQSSNGTFTEYITSLGSHFYFDGVSTFTGSITNISIKEVGQNWDILTEGWIIDQTNSKATCDGTQTATTSLKSSGIIGIQNELVSISFEVKDYSAGILSVTLEGTGGNDFPSITANGTYTKEVTSTDNLPKLLFNANTDFIGSVTNVKIIEISTDTNLPRINYEGFSYQDALGSELIVNGDFATDSNWNKDANWSIANGVATSTGVGRMFQSIPFLETNVGTKVKVSFDIVDYTSAGVIINCYGGVSSLFQGVGSYSFITTTTNTLNLYVNNGGQGNLVGSIDNVSVKEYLGQSVVPESGCGSWLWEPQSTNLITYSEDFSQWTSASTTPTLNSATSPSGDVNSAKLTSTGVYGSLNLTISKSISAFNYTQSVFVKAVNYSIVNLISYGSSSANRAQVSFDLSDGSISSAASVNGTYTNPSASIEDYGNGWYRISLSFTSDASVEVRPHIQFPNQMTSSDYVLIWGAMLEENSFSTSYIPTSGSTVTRNQDVCNNGGSLASINSTSGTLYAEIAVLADGVGTRTMSLSDGTNNNSITIRYTTNSGRINAFIVAGGFMQFSANISGVSVLNFNKVAIKYSLNNMALWINGVEVATDTSGTMPLGLNEINFTRGDGANKFFGKTKALAVWKEALSDSELQSLTTI